MHAGFREKECVGGRGSVPGAAEAVVFWLGYGGGGCSVLASRTAAPHGEFQVARRRPLGLLGWFCFPKFPPSFKPPLCSRFSWVFSGSLSSARRFSLFLSLFVFFCFSSSSFFRSLRSSFSGLPPLFYRGAKGAGLHGLSRAAWGAGQRRSTGQRAWLIKA